MGRVSALLRSPIPARRCAVRAQQLSLISTAALSNQHPPVRAQQFSLINIRGWRRCSLRALVHVVE
eukprot:5715521-Prymnesium_polylepis.2